LLSDLLFAIITLQKGRSKLLHEAVIVNIEHHKAGHAVAAYVQGVALAYVTNLPGSATALTRSAVYLPHDADRQTKLTTIKKDIVVCLAGPYAQRRYRVPTIKCPEWDEDIQNARRFALAATLVDSGFMIHPNDPEPIEIDADQATFANDFLQQCNTESLNLVAEHWPAIVRVAKALLSRPVLDADDLDELIRDMPAKY
jgi:ATP-dependent Zn protease